MSAIHLCIDMQQVEKFKFSFFPREWDLLDNTVCDLANRLGSRGVETLYIGHTDGADYDEGVFRLHEASYKNSKLLDGSSARGLCALAIDVPRDALIGFKEFYSAVDEDAITEFVLHRAPSLIILSGVFEAVCKELISGRCLSETARDFAEAGYQVVIAAEATNRGVATRPTALSLAERHAAHQIFGVSVRPIEQIIQMIERDMPTLSGLQDRQATASSICSLALR